MYTYKQFNFIKCFFVFGGLLLLINLFGCVNIKCENEIMYSREDITQMESSDSFGYGRSDDIYIVLSYMYNNEDLLTKHGNNFQITSEDIICHSSEGKSFFFLSFYVGKAEYTIGVDNNYYYVKLSKEKSSKWHIDEFREIKTD